MIPLSKIKSYLNVSDNKHDALLSIILERTIDLANKYFDCPIKRTEVRRLKKIYNSTIILYEIEPEVRKVEVIYGTTKEQVVFYQKGKVVKMPIPIFEGTAMVTMSVGWSEIPPAVEFAIVKEVAYEFLKSLQGEGRLGKNSVSESVGGSNLSTSYSQSEFFSELSKFR